MTDVARREQILEAADRLLRHYGPQKTTVADVAREAGVGVGSVYLEFASKEAIVEALSSSRYEAVLGAMRDAGSREDRSWGERLTGALDARLGAYLSQAEGGAHACDLFHCANAAVKSAAERFHQEEHALVTGILRAGNQAGELHIEEPELAATAILRAHKTFTPPWIFMGEREETWRLARAVNAILLFGITRRARNVEGVSQASRAGRG